MRVGVLVSGRGSNLRALLAAFPQGHPLVQIVCAISNRPTCLALDHVRQAGIPTHVVSRRDYSSRQAQQQAMAAILITAGVELMVLAGYDQLLRSTLLDPFEGRVINIHPSLLPAFAGTLHAQAEALRYGVKVSGCTVHFVIDAVDAGPIIAQASVPLHEDDDETSLAARILAQEHILLPRAVSWIAEGRVRIVGRRVFIDDASPINSQALG